MSEMLLTMVSNQTKIANQHAVANQNQHHDLELHDDRRPLHKDIKLDFPQFFDENPTQWIFKANQFFEYHHTPPPQRLLMASYHMNGEALVWYQDAVKSTLFNMWEAFTQALVMRFGPTAYDDPTEALTRLEQTSTVASYKAHFESLSKWLKGLSDSHKLSYFLSGLKDEVHLLVWMLNPLSLNAVFGLAKIQKKYLLSTRKTWRSASEGSQASPKELSAPKLPSSDQP